MDAKTQKTSILQSQQSGLRIAAAFWFFCLVFLPFQLSAQNYALRQYTEAEGLAQNYIYTLFQDQRGFLYAGTGAGLSRFDGQSFRNFTEADSMPESFVTASLVAENGEIWLGHNQGAVSRFDGTYSFSLVQGKDSAFSRVNDLAQAPDGAIWIVTQNDGLWRYEEGKTLQNFSGELKYYLLYHLAFTPEGNLLIGTNEGLQEFEVLDDSTVALVDYAAGIPETRITSLEPMLDGEGFWVGTEDEGLCKYQTGKTTLKYGKSSGLKTEEIQSLCEDGDGYLWVTYGTGGFSRFRINSDSLQTVDLFAGPDQEETVFQTVFIDGQGQVWLGSYGSGLFYLKDRKFTTFRVQEGWSNQVNALLQDQNGDYWLGTHQGLICVEQDSLNQEFLFVGQNPGINYHPKAYFTTKEGLPGNVITAIFEDKNGIIWGGTEDHGAFRINPENGEIRAIQLGEFSLYQSVNSITGDNEGNVWFATKGGACCYFPDSGKIDEYTTEQGLPHNNIFEIFQAHSGEIWFATHSRNIPVLRNGKVGNLVPEGRTTMPSAVNSFAEDHSNVAWIASREHGIFVYSPSGNVENYTREDGLLSNYCYLIIPDEYDNIWIGHRRGFTKFNRRTQTFVIYDEKNGFPQDVINPNAAIIDSYGHFWFGTLDGLLRYDPAREMKMQGPPNTFISGVTVLDEPVDPGEELVLPYKKYTFRFEFFGLSFQDQELVSYQYKLEGNDIRWSAPTSATYADYQGLSDGKYRFLVKACNSEGMCNEQPVAFSFTIETPFWKRTWFIVLVVLALLASVWLIVNWRLRRLAQEKERLQSLVDDRTRELKTEKDKVENLNRNLERLVEQRTEQLAEANQELSINNQKLEDAANQLRATLRDLDTLLYRASHDLKQPIASVQGLLYILEMEVSDPEVLNYVKMLSTSTTRLDNVVQDLVDVSLVTQHKTEWETLELNSVIDRILDNPKEAENFALINWKVEIPQGTRVRTDSYLLRNALDQLFRNAVQYRSREIENPRAKVWSEVQEDEIRIFVEDNGIGMEPEVLENAFQMFFHGTKDISGSGLGLYLVRAAVERMGGRVKVSSESGKGTRFTICLPTMPSESGE